MRTHNNNRMKTHIHVVIYKDDEINMTFLGFLVFFDPIKSEVLESISNLNKLGISLKIISGDNRHVAKHVGQQIRTIKYSGCYWR